MGFDPPGALLCREEAQPAPGGYVFAEYPIFLKDLSYLDAKDNYDS